MGRSPCCDDHEEKPLKKGPWTPEEDEVLIDYINSNGVGSWRALPKMAGLNRCGKSCRLRWTNYLRPDIKRGKFTEEEERTIINLHATLGNKWSRIAGHLHGRTDNEIKNYWNTHIRKKLLQNGIDPNTHKPRTDLNPLLNLSQLITAVYLANPFGSSPNLDTTTLLKLQADAAKIQLLQNLLQIMNTNNNVNASNVDVSNVLNSVSANPRNFAEKFLCVSSKMIASNQELSNPIVTPNTHGLYETNTSSKYELPALVSVSPDMNQTESKDNFNMTAMVQRSGAETFSWMNQSGTWKTDPMAEISPCVSDSSIFQAWEKILDDEPSDSCWKSFLDLTSTTSSPGGW